MEKGASIAAAAGQAIAQIGAIMAAASQAKIAGIDREIAAEKKRDGKSKESLAKIAKLEKKKEAAKRKAFEQNKKMQMAQTIANTASAAAILRKCWRFPIRLTHGCGYGSYRCRTVSYYRRYFISRRWVCWRRCKRRPNSYFYGRS